MITVETVERPQAGKTPSPSVQVFLSNVRKKWELYSEADSENRAEAFDDLQFYSGDQWPAAIRNMRDLERRPCHTVNRLPQFVNQIANEQRQARPSIHVNPLGNGATKETAEILQGSVRHIELISDADEAYDTGFLHMSQIGWGAWRIVTDYADPRSFVQEIYIRKIANAFSLFLDPSSRESTYIDATGLFIISDVPKDEFKEMYPNSEMASLVDWARMGLEVPNWATKDACRVAEYFEVTEKKKKLVKLRIPGMPPKSTNPAHYIHLFEDEMRDMFPNATENDIEEYRPSKQRIVTWYKFNALEILDERVLPGTHIPVVPEFGIDLDINGKRKLMGLIRNAKDPQRMYNYWVSAQTEAIALAPKAPYVAAAGQIEDFKEQWSQSNRRNQAVLPYKPITVDEQLVPPPQRNQYEPPIAALVQATRQADADLKATTGLYNPSLGLQGDQSGRAIQLLQRQGETANFQFMDNHRRAIRLTGTILLEYIPIVYDTERIIRIVKPDLTSEMVTVNGQTVYRGVKKVFQLGTGTYDVVVTTGPSYLSKRQEAAASIIQLIQFYPGLMPLAGDILISNMDWPGADEVAKRLKKSLPPNLKEPELDENGQPIEPVIPPEIQAKLQQDTQLIAQLTAKIQEMEEIIRTKKIEIASRETITALQEKTKLIIAEAQISKEQGLAQMREESARLEMILDQGHEQMMKEMDARIEAANNREQEKGQGGVSGADDGSGSGDTGTGTGIAVPSPSMWPYNAHRPSIQPTIPSGLAGPGVPGTGM